MPRKTLEGKKQLSKRDSNRRRPSFGSSSEESAEEQPSKKANKTGKKKSSVRPSAQFGSSSEEGDSDDRPSTSTQAKKKQNATLTQNIPLGANNTADIATLTTNTVKYLLNLSATKIPIKRADICRSVNIPSKMFADVLEACAAVLKNAYGMEVSEISEGKSSKVYIIHSSFNYAITAIQVAPNHRFEVSLLFLVLSYIFMKGGEVKEGKNLMFTSCSAS